MKPVKLDGTLGDAGLHVIPNENIREALQQAICVLDVAHYSAMDLLDECENRNLEYQAAALGYVVLIAKGLVESAVVAEQGREAAS